MPPYPVQEFTNCCTHWVPNPAYPGCLCPNQEGEAWTGEWHNFGKVPTHCLPCDLACIRDYSNAMGTRQCHGYTVVCPIANIVSATLISGRTIGPGDEVYAYCGPGAFGCCTLQPDNPCTSTSLASCWASGGATQKAFWSVGDFSYTWETDCQHMPCDMVWCCIYRSFDNRYLCRTATSVEQCDACTWPNATECYTVTGGAPCNEVCGQPIPCCIDGVCSDRMLNDCQNRGGFKSGTCTECADPATCCPPPKPCCLCDGSCIRATQELCRTRHQGIPLPDRNVCDSTSQATCQRWKRRPPCKGAPFMPVPAPTDSERYEFVSSGTLSDVDQEVEPEHRWAHSWDKVWMCNRWNRWLRKVEQTTCGFVLQENGSIGNCYPEGYGAISCGWRPPCPNIP